MLGEWKHKADDIMAELEASKSECRNYSSEVQGIKITKMIRMRIMMMKRRMMMMMTIVISGAPPQGRLRGDHRAT